MYKDVLFFKLTQISVFLPRFSFCAEYNSFISLFSMKVACVAKVDKKGFYVLIFSDKIRNLNLDKALLFSKKQVICLKK